MMQLYVAVDHNCRELLLKAPWMKLNHVEVVGNTFDTNRFKPRPALPERPKKALVFSNNAGLNTYLEAVQEACKQEGIELDIIGAGIGNEERSPEGILPQYDLVFAKARCALEAMAVGAAVILCDSRGLGPMVKRSDLETLRRWNFGMRLLTHPLQPNDIARRIKEYDHKDASEVSAAIREQASLESAVTKYCQLYTRLRRNKREITRFRRHSPSQRLRCRDQALMALRLKSRLERIRPGEEFFVSVVLRRWTLKPVATASPWPTLISYRWRLEDEDLWLRTEGVRSMVLPPVPWGYGGTYKARIIAPLLEGNYRLRVTLVQEDWRWLDEKSPEVFDEMAVRVEPNSRAFYSRG